MDEKLYRTLIARMAKIQVDIFAFPPKTMEELNRRIGAYEELRFVTLTMEAAAKGKEKD